MDDSFNKSYPSTSCTYVSYRISQIYPCNYTIKSNFSAFFIEIEIAINSIIIIEDDLDDQDVLKEVFQELDYLNQVIFFDNGETALEQLTLIPDQPFLILSDINLPKLDGFKLRDKIHNNEQLKLKCIPYLFFTTSIDQKSVIDAYSKSIQGFFIKPVTYKELLRVIRNIVEYWKDCQSPNVVTS